MISGAVIIIIGAPVRTIKRSIHIGLELLTFNNAA